VALARRIGVNAKKPVDRDHTVDFANTLSTDQTKAVQLALRGAVVDAAASLSLSTSRVRSNLFGTTGEGILGMVDALGCNMNHKPERSLQIRVGEGVSGQAFASGRTNVAVLHEDWGKYVLPGSEMAKLHPDLCWIISIPVLSGPGNEPFWILNIDGLDRAADEATTEEKLTDAALLLFYWANALANVIAEAS
jgi:hypothetical protein